MEHFPSCDTPDFFEPQWSDEECMVIIAVASLIVSILNMKNNK